MKTQKCIMNRDKILKDLESVFQMALQKKSYAIALRAKESQCKMLGHLETDETPQSPRISAMNIAELEALLQEVNNNIKAEQQKKPEKTSKRHKHQVNSFGLKKTQDMVNCEDENSPKENMNVYPN